jgi:formylglycine-generating enzyme required for sulfatase activity
VFRASAPAVGAGARAGAANSGWQRAFDDELPVDQAELERALGCNTSPTDPRATWGSPDNDARPINCVLWGMAFAFCIWDGGRLPTEAEWNYAAAGGDEQRVQVWSKPPTAGEATSEHAYFGCDVNNTCEPPMRVGSFPLGAGKWGHMDLGANVSEWMLDRIEYQQPTRYKNPCNDCVDVIEGSTRAIRGGNFTSKQPEELRVAVRGEGGYTVGLGLGFRCAR